MTAGVTTTGCAHKKDDKKVPMDRGVTDLAPGKAVPASAVPPDPSYVYVPAGATQPKFVPVDMPTAAPAAPVAIPAPDPMAGISAAPAAAPAPAAPVTSAPVVTHTPAAPAAGLAKQYLVQKGDTLFAIAKTHYGNGNRWQQIAQVNPGLTPGTLKAGSTIVVP
jgi:nucleoid-associated protein YgaU